MKYKTLAELKAAYDSGALDREECPLMLDNDNSTVYDKRGRLVYEGPGREGLAKQALTLLGVPCENV